MTLSPRPEVVVERPRPRGVGTPRGDDVAGHGENRQQQQGIRRPAGRGRQADGPDPPGHRMQARAAGERCRGCGSAGMVSRFAPTPGVDPAARGQGGHDQRRRRWSARRAARPWPTTRPRRTVGHDRPAFAPTADPVSAADAVDRTAATAVGRRRSVPTLGPVRCTSRSWPSTARRAGARSRCGGPAGRAPASAVAADRTAVAQPGRTVSGAVGLGRRAVVVRRGRSARRRGRLRRASGGWSGAGSARAAPRTGENEGAAPPPNVQASTLPACGW